MIESARIAAKWHSVLAFKRAIATKTLSAKRKHLQTMDIFQPYRTAP